MKSPMVEEGGFISDKENYTDMMVLESNGAWYVGTLHTYFDEELGMHVIDPGTRDSDYFATEKEANDFLDLVLSTGDTSQLRDHP